jgi:hypothetical protein
MKSTGTGEPVDIYEGQVSLLHYEIVGKKSNRGMRSGVVS